MKIVYDNGVVVLTRPAMRLACMSGVAGFNLAMVIWFLVSTIIPPVIRMSFFAIFAVLTVVCAAIVVRLLRLSYVVRGVVFRPGVSTAEAPTADAAVGQDGQGIPTNSQRGLT